MVIKKSSIVSFGIVTVSVLSSAALAAVEGSSPDASFAGWPLPLLIGLVLVFKKQIFSEVRLDIEEAERQEVGDEPETVEPVEEVAPVAEIVPEVVVVKKKEKKIKASVVDTSATDNKKASKKSSSPEVVDLSSDTQCQASTAKGTRCKRKTGLETVKKVINNKAYVLKICNQHNNKKLKVFFGLIKP